MKKGPEPMKKGRATWLRIKAAFWGRPKFAFELPEETAYLDEGWLAARAGRKLADNPYRVWSQESDCYGLGFRQWQSSGGHY